MKDIVFDGCTEVLLQDIIDSSSEKDSDVEAALQQLPDFQKLCENQELCPKGELIRGLMCRNYLRDAVQRMRKKLASVEQDGAINGIIETTEKFVETIGEETEAERAYIVVRNLVIVSENIAKQTKRQVLPVIPKQPVQMKSYHIEREGIREFEEIAGVKRDKKLERFLQAKLPPLTAKQECESRYKNLFFNVLLRLIVLREMEEGVQK